MPDQQAAASATVLAEVEFHTSLGAVYRFPDVEERTLDFMVSTFGYSSQVTLTNVSGACLVLPARIVERILIGGRERWRK